MWQWSAKKDGSIFRQLDKQGDFTVLVNLTENTRDLEFFIVPTHKLNHWLEQDFERWKATPGKAGRQRSPSNPKRNLNRNDLEKQLENYMIKEPKDWGLSLGEIAAMLNLMYVCS